VSRGLGITSAALSRLRLLNFRYLRDHPLRTTLSLGVIALSAAMIVAVFGTYGSVGGSVQRLVEDVAGNADLEVTGVTDDGLNQDLVDMVNETAGVKAAVPLIESPVVLNGAQTMLYGGDERVRALSSSLRQAIDAVPQDKQKEGGIFVGPALVGTATAGRLAHVVSMFGRANDVLVTDTVRGKAAASINHGSLVIAPLPLAQRLAGRPHQIDSILIVVAPGETVGALHESLSKTLRGKAFVTTPTFRVAQADSSTAMAQSITLLVSLLALAVAAFLVFNTMNMAANERRAEMASLRALGARSGPIMRDFLFESFCLAVVGATVGSLAGVGIAAASVSKLPSAVIMAVDAKIGFVMPLYAFPIAFAACITACLAASWLAARRVSRVQPVEAMRTDSTGTVSGEPTRRRSLGVLAVGAVLVVAALAIAVACNDERAFVGGPAFLVGVILLGYAAIAPLTRMVRAVAGWQRAPGRLAAASVERSPQRIWATTMTVCLAVAIGVAITGSSQNTVAAASADVATLSHTDFFVQGAAEDELPVRPVLPRRLESRLAAVPGVREVVAGQFTYANFNAGRALVQGIAGESNSTAYQLSSPSARRQLLAGTGAVISRLFARQHRLATGDTLTLPTLVGDQRLRIADVVDYISVDAGLVAISLDNLQRWFHRDGASYYEVMLTPTANHNSVAGALLEAAAGLQIPVHVLTGAEAVRVTELVVQQVGAIAVALQWIVASIAGLALLNTLMLSVVERRRELGILRALGASRRLIRQVVLSEALSVGVVGGVLGLLVGLVLQYLATTVLGKVMALRVPFQVMPVVLLMALGALAVALAGALPPARTAGRLRVIEAIGYE
jgi:putative ABC transport system permease protein